MKSKSTRNAPRDTKAAGRMARYAGQAAIGVAAAQYLPATVTLGQWTSLRRLPGDFCRWRGPSRAEGIALTFDDGPNPESTPCVLDRLDELGLPATFFCVGELVEREPDLVRELRRRGHQVETHGYRHEHHLVRTPRWVAADLDSAGRAMAAVGLESRWYRPSYGQATGATLLAARRRGLRTVLWSAWGREWATPEPERVAARIIRDLVPGAIVLLHDNDAFGPAGMWRVGLAALDEVKAEIDRRGLVCQTLDELMG
jgi:peptidoglycan-N-acetylglucosamine deacetylase